MILISILIAVAIIIGLLGLSVYMLRPETEKTRSFAAFDNTMIAHRGLFNNNSDAPENSLAAFRNALEHGFGMELDVQLTKDGKLVVFHDFDLKRMCGVHKKLTELTYAELEQYSLNAGFQEYSRILTTKLLQAVYTFLWSLLLLIPGIIKHYSYAMTDYILKDEPELCNNAAIERSMAMMEGNKMKLFLLDLSFIGWAILCLFTFGIGFFVLQPYVQVSHAAFYEDLKAQQGGININVEVTVES